MLPSGLKELRETTLFMQTSTELVWRWETDMERLSPDLYGIAKNDKLPDGADNASRLVIVLKIGGICASPKSPVSWLPMDVPPLLDVSMRGHYGHFTEASVPSCQPSMRPLVESKFTPISLMGSPQSWNFS